MPGRTQSREAWEGEKERAGRGPALTWGGTAGRALTLPSAVACLPTRSQPPARLRVPLHTWEIGLVFTVAGPDLCGLGERVACLPPVGLPVSMLTSPSPTPSTEVDSHPSWHPGACVPTAAAVWPPCPRVCLVLPHAEVLRVCRLLPSSPSGSQSCVPIADFWDTAGQERFQSMHASYYHKAHACIMV